MTNHDFDRERASGQRFAFGHNWASFLDTLDEDRIRTAEASLAGMLGAKRMDGQTFLDAGCGSGLFSLAARRLGARVRSFDYDPESVACAQELKRRYYPNDAHWTVERGSVLDAAYLAGLGPHDVVYSWGVLHHTGDMWTALDGVAGLVALDGRLFIALYNDQGLASRVWLKVKRAYNRGGLWRWATLAVYLPYFFALAVAAGLVRHKTPWGRFVSYRRERGMSMYHDWIDWLGGLPFEVARPGEVLDFCRERGFELVKLVATNRMGTNQFVFRRA